MTSILRHVAEAFPPARQGTILNSHRVIGINDVELNELVKLYCVTKIIGWEKATVVQFTISKPRLPRLIT